MPRTALITGAAVRIGRAIALGLADAGIGVVAHYHSSAREADEVVALIREKGGEAAAIQADLRSLDQIDRLAQEATEVFGGIDILINNASVFPPEPLGEVTEAIWDEAMAVNLKAPFFLMQKLAPALRKGGGVVVNLADLAGIQAWKGYSAHGVSKAGLIHLTRSAARTLGPDIRVVAIAPGTVLPPDDFPEKQIEKLAANNPIKRNGSPEDVVEAVLYLIDAEFVTGEVLVIDGGRSAVP